MHTPTRQSTHMHARTHAHAYTQTYMQYLLLLYGSHDSQTHLDVTLYANCLACLKSVCGSQRLFLIKFGNKYLCRLCIFSPTTDTILFLKFICSTPLRVSARHHQQRVYTLSLLFIASISLYTFFTDLVSF